MNSHYATMLRGAIVPLMLEKSLLSPHEVVKESAVLTLMNTDLEELASGVLNIHLLWSSVLEVVLAVYMLADYIGGNIFYVLFPLVCKLFSVEFFSAMALTDRIYAPAAGILSIGLSKWQGSSSGAWNKAIEKRVGRTARALSQMKSLKMIGLENAVSNQIQKLRVAEVSGFKFSMLLSTLIAVICEY
jgi:hypothetical protein